MVGSFEDCVSLYAPWMDRLQMVENCTRVDIWPRSTCLSCPEDSFVPCLLPVLDTVTASNYIAYLPLPITIACYHRWCHCMLHGWIVGGWFRIAHVLVQLMGSADLATRNCLLSSFVSLYAPSMDDRFSNPNRCHCMLHGWIV